MFQREISISINKLFNSFLLLQEKNPNIPILDPRKRKFVRTKVLHFSVKMFMLAKGIYLIRYFNKKNLLNSNNK